MIKPENKPTQLTSKCHVDEAIFIRHKDVRRKVLYTNIMWIEANGSYCDIYLSNGDKLTIVHTLTSFQDKIPESLFIRIHRSYIINIHHVEGLIGNMVYVGKRTLPVSCPYYKDLAACFDILEDSNTLFKYKKRYKK